MAAAQFSQFSYLPAHEQRFEPLFVLAGAWFNGSKHAQQPGALGGGPQVIFELLGGTK